jgi:hypothetical protein
MDWITYRRPTLADADSNGEVKMARRTENLTGFNDALVDWSYVEKGVPWTHTSLWSPQCSRCRFALAGDDGLYTCRQRPPQIGPRGTQWPTVDGQSWCGSYEAIS